MNDDIIQFDYFPEEKTLKINLPEEVWKNIDTVIMTRLFQEELVVEGYCKIAEKRISETTSDQSELPEIERNVPQRQFDWLDELMGVSK